MRVHPFDPPAGLSPAGLSQGFKGKKQERSVESSLDIRELDALIERGRLEALDDKFLKSAVSELCLMYLQGIPAVILSAAGAFFLVILCYNDSVGLDWPPFLPLDRPTWGMGGVFWQIALCSMFFILSANTSGMLVTMMQRRGRALLWLLPQYATIAVYLFVLTIIVAGNPGATCPAGQVAFVITVLCLFVWILVIMYLERISPGLGLESFQMSWWMPYWFAVLAVSFCTTEAVMQGQCGQRPWILGILGLVFALFGIFVRVQYMQRRRRVDDYVAADREAYANTWKDVLKEQGDGLQQVEKECTKFLQRTATDINEASLRTGASKKDLRHSKEADEEAHEPERTLARDYCVELLDSGQAAGGPLKPRQRLDDLAVLFAQASRLNPLFQEVVRQWASTDVYKETPKWTECGVKKRKRAIQKVHRTYYGNASKVLDLVRSGITFDNAADLAKCLELIRNDERCAVLSVKNWFREDFVAETGYRKVGLTLIIVDEDTIREGVERHICEVILSLKAFDEKKKKGGHDKYVKWRDAQVQ